jgi:hypothetical protein
MKHLKYGRTMLRPLLTAVLWIGLAGTMPAREHAGPVQPPHSPGGEEVFLAHATHCLQTMKEAAAEMSVEGVAVLAYIPGEEAQTWISRMQVVGSLTGRNANFLSVAYSKAGEMADTFMDSGSGIREPLHGEFGYQGGVIEKVGTGYILAVFSGGTGEEDTVIARKGLDELIQGFGQ